MICRVKKAENREGLRMETGLVLMSKLAGMLLMVVVGYGAVKLHVVESDDSKILSRLIVYILQPCLICRSFQIDLTPERLNGFLCALGLGVCTYGIWIAALELLKKPLGLDAVDRCSMIYSNVGNLALPLINMILGSEYVFYASALQVPFNLFVWTHGNSVISGEKRLHFRKIIFNPNIIALLAGLLVLSFRIRLPDALDTAVDGLGSMVGACSMLVIGMVITRNDLKKTFTNGRAYAITLGRLIVMPASLLLLFRATGIFKHYPALVPVFQVCFIALCTPTASTVSQLAVLYNNKAYETSVYSVISMALCVVTMPLMLVVFQKLF